MINQIKDHLQKNQLKEALDLSMQLVENHENKESYNTLIILQSRLSNVKTNQLRGVISYENAQIHLNQIREGIAELISEYNAPRRNPESFEIERSHAKLMANLLNRLNEIEAKIGKGTLESNNDQITKLELERQDFLKNYIEEGAKSFENKAKFVIINRNLIEKLDEILDEMKLQIGRKNVFMQVGKKPIKEDQNSPMIFSNIRKFESQNQVKHILTQIAGDLNTPMEKAWKALVLLTYYRSEEALSQIKNLIERESENKVLNKFVHLDCIKYLDSITNLSFKDRIISTYKFAIENCPTSEARLEAIKSLSRKSDPNSDEALNILVNTTYNDENNQVRAQAVNGLYKFNISSRLQDLKFWLSDGNNFVKKEAINIATKYTEIISFDEIKDLFEVETDAKNRELFVELLLKINREKTMQYGELILDSGFDNQMNSILIVFGRYKICNLKSKVNEKKENGFFSNNHVLNEYLRKCKV